MKRFVAVFMMLSLVLFGCTSETVRITYDIDQSVLGDTDKAIGLEGKKGSVFDEDFFLTKQDLKLEYQEIFKGWYKLGTDEEITDNYIFNEDTIIEPIFYTEEEIKEQEEYDNKIKENIKKRREENAKLEKKKKQQETEQEINSFEPNEDQLKMIQATTQIAIKDHGFEDDTSVFLEDWNITVHTQFEELRWMAVTNTNKNGRIKVMFDWSGKDEDDLILVYMLVKGNTVLDNR